MNTCKILDYRQVINKKGKGRDLRRVIKTSKFKGYCTKLKCIPATNELEQSQRVC